MFGGCKRNSFNNAQSFGNSFEQIWISRELISIFDQGQS